MYEIYKAVTGTSGLKTIKVTEAHQDASPMALVEAVTTSLTLGDAINIDLGYVGDHDQVFTGYVKEITRTTPPTIYKISSYGVLVRAVDYFVASRNPDNPFTRNNIAAEDLIEDVINLCGLTNYGSEPTSFTFATQGPVEVNLVSCYEYCHQIANTLAWHLYGDQTGKVWFVERWNGLMGGDSPTKTINNAKVLQTNRIISTRDLRNRIVVYGRSGIHAVAKSSSPHLPGGFYQSVVASADWIDTQQMADLAASRNLALLNKLGEACQITLLGDSSYSQRQIVTYNDAEIGASGDWYVGAVDHTISDTGGYITTLSLKK